MLLHSVAVVLVVVVVVSEKKPTKIWTQILLILMARSKNALALDSAMMTPQKHAPHQVVVEEEEEEVLKERAANPKERAANPEKVKSVAANPEKEERPADADAK